MIHRDIKPGNVLLAPAPRGTEPYLRTSPLAAEGAGLTVKLGDFGLGKLHADDGGDPLTQLTRTGAHIGTPAWMAPEQIDRAFGPVGPATDVHGLGLLLDRLLTGRALRSGGTTAETYRQVLVDEPAPADRVARGVPRDLAAVCLKCLARKPADRYPSAAALAADLDRWLDGLPTVARPLSAAGRATRWIRRRPVVAALAAAAVAATLVAGTVGLQQLRERRAAARQQDELRRSSAAAELRRGFEALRTGNVAGALEQLEATRTLDPALAGSLAGRWLVRRTHGEREILLDAAASGDRPAKMPRELYGIVVNSAGTIAAAAGADGSIHLLHGLDGSPSISTVAAHDEVNDVCFSPAGTLLASAGEDGLLRWWRVTETGLVAAGEARPGAGPLYAVAFAPDGRAIAAGGADCVVRLMNLAASEDPVELFRFEPPADTSPDIESIVFVNAGVLAASCGNRVVLLDATTGQLVRECDRPVIKASQAVFGGLTVSPDGARIMACGTDKRAHAWDVATGRIAVSLPTHPGWVQGCAFSADGMRVATACRDGGIRLFDATTGALLDRLVGHRGRVWSVAFEPSDALLSAGADGTVRRWDARGVTEAGLFRQIPSAAPEIITVFEAAWPLAGDPRGAIVACDCRRIPWAFDTSRNEAHVMTLPDVAPLWSLAADGRTGRLAVTRAVASPVMVFEPGASGAAAVPVALPDGIDSADALACWTPAGDLVIRSRDGGLFWCPSDLRPVRRVGSTSGTVHGVAAAPAWPPRVATWGDRAAVHQLPRSAADHADIPAPLVLPVADETTAVAWSPDAALVAVGTRTGAVHVFDAATGALRGTLAPHEHAIEALAFAGDGRTLVAADTDCVRVSDVATLSTFDHVRPGWNVRTLVLSADGDRLVIGGVAGETPDPGTARVGVMEFPKP